MESFLEWIGNVIALIIMISTWIILGKILLFVISIVF